MRFINTVTKVEVDVPEDFGSRLGAEWKPKTSAKPKATRSTSKK